MEIILGFYMVQIRQLEGGIATNFFLHQMKKCVSVIWCRRSMTAGGRKASTFPAAVSVLVTVSFANFSFYTHANTSTY